MPRMHDIQKLSFEDGRMHLPIDGRQYTFDLADLSIDGLLGVRHHPPEPKLSSRHGESSG